MTWVEKDYARVCYGVKGGKSWQRKTCLQPYPPQTPLSGLLWS